MKEEEVIGQDDTVMGRLVSKHADLIEVPQSGQIITGHILDKTRNTMYLDLGPYGVGVIYGKELYDHLDTHESAKIGDPIQATIRDLENEDGVIELSLRDATRERSWDELTRRLDKNEIFETEILDANKGGLIVRISGTTGFLPVSQLAPDHYPRVEGGDKGQILDRLKSYIGDQFKVKVITAIQDQEKLIVSEKAAIGDELSATLDKLKEGSSIEGVISGVADFGAFIKFKIEDQELEGLVHISELAWQRIDDPADIVTAGDKVEAKIIGVEGLRISLSIKQLREDPWVDAAKKYEVDQTVSGEVLKVTPFGGFIKLDNDIHGLVHISELPEDKQTTPEDILKPGEKMDFKIISLDPKEHRLGLSIKAIAPKDKPKIKKGSRKSSSRKKPPKKKEKTAVKKSD